MRTSVGAAFHIRSSVGLNFNDGEIQENKEAQPIITDEAIQNIMGNDEIKYYNASNSGYIKSDAVEFIPGVEDTADNNMGQVEALTYSALDSAFREKTLELTEGRHITKNDENAILISEELAAYNNLSVGDKLIFTHAMLDVEGSNYVDGIRDKTAYIEAEIIGIYKIMKPQGNAGLQPTAGLLANQIYSDHSFLINLHMADKGCYMDGASFFIGDPINLDAIVSEVKSQDSIDWDKFFIRKDDFNYEKIESGLQTIQNLVTILLVCVSVVSLAVLMLILALRIRNRIHEAGMLLSIGLSKKEIVGQFIAEVAVVAIIAFVCSYFAAGFVAGTVENNVLADMHIGQVAEQVVETGLQAGTAQAAYLSMAVMETIFIYISQFMVITAAVLLSSLAVIRLKPREILSKMS